MPRPRTPEAVAKLTGAAANHPERYKARSEPESTGPFGNPPAFLSKEEKKAWRDFASEWSWLTRGDRAAMVALCKLRALIERPEGPPASGLYTEYRLALSSFGGQPTTRSKVYQPKTEEEDDPFAAFGKPN